MRVILILIMCIMTVLAVNKHKNSLTESMGQEVIEIGAPLKELPPDIEEEPSAENDDDNSTTTTTIKVATQKDLTMTTVERVGKSARKAGIVKDEDEARIEKELADLYKDSLDYKADSGEVIKETREPNVTESSEKPIMRARNNFKFQPDSNNPREVAIFRTSIDEISCRKNKLVGVVSAETEC
ncbi:unnamed protein product [Euphydryas editha]|uniref:Secreted protein n=1 Tax=Euphydryas editha TaxID=104508 RepID=A0AAU9T9K8_EUPED|nr:unnamed protein product [Euphydryas editha]